MSMVAQFLKAWLHTSNRDEAPCWRADSAGSRWMMAVSS